MLYLTSSDVEAINSAEVGEGLLADFGLLEAAIQRPQQTVMGEEAYPDIHQKAAALMHSLIRNHPFIDGNKRTAVAAVVTFYKLNGYQVRAQQGEVVALAVDVAEGQLDVSGIAGVLKMWAHDAFEDG